MSNVKRYRVEGVTDERDSCDCCGRSDLKRVVVLWDFDSDDFTYFGTTCAARAMGVATKVANAAIREAVAAKAEADRVERARVAQARHDEWVAFLVERTGGIRDWGGAWDLRAMFDVLGGFGPARAAFADR